METLKMADNKITTTELQEMFGDEIPMDAFAVLANPPGYATPDDVRAILRDIARSHAPDEVAKRDLIGFINSWVEKHDLKRSDAERLSAQALGEWINRKY